MNHSEQSPNGKHKAELIFEGEIRFGPVFFKLALDNKVLEGPIFGGVLSWSNDSNFLAVQEWLEQDYQKGPMTRAVIIDLDKQAFAALKSVEKGFAEDFCFSSQIFMYKKHYYRSGVIEEVEVEMQNLQNWKALNAF